MVVLSQFAEPEYALALLEEGSARRAYLLKERVNDLEELTGGDPRGGGGWFSDRLEGGRGARGRGSGQESSPLDSLTPRERDALTEMARGKNNAAIAAALVITEQSVEKYIHSIFQKLDLTWQEDVHRRVKAVLLYLSEERM